MEIDITRFFHKANHSAYSASIAETGLQNIGAITWDNAKRSKWRFVNRENHQEIRDYITGFGAWEREAIQSWSLRELNALLIQLMAGDIREAKSVCNGWKSYDREASRGKVSGRFYRGDDKRIYYYIGV